MTSTSDNDHIESQPVANSTNNENQLFDSSSTKEVDENDITFTEVTVITSQDLVDEPYKTKAPPVLTFAQEAPGDAVQQPCGIQAQESALQAMQFGAVPQIAVCSKCGYQGLTTLSYMTGKATILSSIACCIIFLPLFVVPFLLQSCKDVQHSCPSCGKMVGKHEVLRC